MGELVNKEFKLTQQLSDANQNATHAAKAKDRLEVLNKIAQFEKAQMFDQDVENDPPASELLPNKIDYKRKKLISRIRRHWAYKYAGCILNKMKRAGYFRLKIDGIENMKSVKAGAIVTCNHFGAIDSFIMDQTFRAANFKHKRMFKVIKEGNYTNPPKGFAPIMRNCDTLPLSRNKTTMKKFMRATNELIQEGNFVLFAPEGAMWWNYRKPRPFKDGAFRFAVKNDVPVIPCFVTMHDSEQIGADGFPVQSHTIHIGEPIYTNDEFDTKQNIEYIKNLNFEFCKHVYEQVYGTPLKY